MNRRRGDPPHQPDPDQLEWWTNLPNLVGQLQRLLKDATLELDRLEKGRSANRKLIVELVIAAIVFNVAVMLLFGHLFDQRDDRRRDDIRSIRQEFYNQCLDIAGNARGINKAVNAAVVSVQRNPVLNPREQAERIAQWENIRQQVPTCHPPDNQIKPNDQGGVR